MKQYIKKYVMVVAILCGALCVTKGTTFGVSDNFRFIIQTIGVPEYNVLGDSINEEIYNTYHIFAYANPIAIYGRSQAQRFKRVPGNGKWTENGGAYCGQGVQGEYDILGVTYSGSLVSNVFFPVDAVPEVLPDRWEFVGVEGAYTSWIDQKNYQTPEQLAYMKTAPILFDYIDYTTNTSDSYHLVEYDLNANKIGLDRAKLNTSSTWKTYGVLSVKRRNNKGQIRYATFSTKPMAASADISSSLQLPDMYSINQGEDGKMSITFGAKAIHLNDNAKVDHIKEICSILYINGEEIAKISASKADMVQKNIEYILPSNAYPKEGTYSINVKVKSYLYTEFYVDGLMQNQIEKNPIIQVKKEKAVPVEDIDMRVLEKREGEMRVAPLIQIEETQRGNTIGFTERGRNVAILLKPKTGEKLEEIRISIDHTKMEYTDMIQKEGMYVLKFKIPMKGESSLSAWSSLRDQMHNYFSVDFDEIGKRRKPANVLKVEYTINGQPLSNEIYFDTIDSYDKNMNFHFGKQILNKEQLLQTLTMEEWMQAKKG